MLSTQAVSSANLKALDFFDSLGDDVAGIASQSPTLLADEKTLVQTRNWKVQFGASGGGSFTDKNPSVKAITIDGLERGDATAIVQTLSHEFGHALYTGVYSYANKAAFNSSETRDEGAATISNIKIQREILAHTNGGVDIGVAGTQGNQYNLIYNQYMKDGNLLSAENKIGAVYSTSESTSTSAGKMTYGQSNAYWWTHTYVPAYNATHVKKIH